MIPQLRHDLGKVTSATQALRLPNILRKTIPDCPPWGEGGGGVRLASANLSEVLNTVPAESRPPPPPSHQGYRYVHDARIGSSLQRKRTTNVNAPSPSSAQLAARKRFGVFSKNTTADGTLTSRTRSLRRCLGRPSCTRRNTTPFRGRSRAARCRRARTPRGSKACA